MQIDLTDATILTGGLTNKLFLVKSPEKVLIRIYGKRTNLLVNRDREMTIMSEASQNRLGPRILSAEDNVRKEEYLEGYKALRSEDLWDIKIIEKVSYKLKKLHNMKIDIGNEPRVLRNIIKWLEPAKMIMPDFLEYDVIENMIEELKNFKGDTGVCHNDLNPTNIMMKDESMRFIDYEYSGYNFIEFDIANFFLEMRIDCSDNQFKYLDVDLSKYEEHFCKVYDVPMTNIRFFKRAANMMWALWSIIMSKDPDNDKFDYLGFAKFRFDLLA